MVRRVFVTLTALTALLVGLVLPAATATTRSSITISPHVYLYEPPAFTMRPTSRPTAAAAAGSKGSRRNNVQSLGRVAGEQGVVPVAVEVVSDQW